MCCSTPLGLQVGDWACGRCGQHNYPHFLHCSNKYCKCYDSHGHLRKRAQDNYPSRPGSREIWCISCRTPWGGTCFKGWLVKPWPGISFQLCDICREPDAEFKVSVDIERTRAVCNRLADSVSDLVHLVCIVFRPCDLEH
jgi:hypothetical protein